MSKPWQFLLGRGDQTNGSENNGVKSGPVDTGPDVPPTVKAAPLDELGRWNETLNLRCSYMAERLEDLASLSAEFSQITKPLEDMAEDLMKSKGRILELDALLSREIEQNKKLNAELASTSDSYLAAKVEHTSLANKSRSLQEALERSEAAASESHVRVNELEKRIHTAQREVAEEVENRKRLELELANLADDHAQKLATLHDLEENNARQSQRNGTLERELVRLQSVIDKQVLGLVEVQGKASEWEKLAQERLQRCLELESKLEAHVADRRRLAHQHEANLSSLQAEKSSLELKLETANAGLQSAEQTIEQTREQLAEKDASFRMAEESLRIGEKQRAGLDRQVALLSQNLGDATNQLAESQRLAEALAKRCDMLAKALSAKDAAYEGAADKARALSERIDEITRRSDLDRSALESANRRLVEELENERAERTLAQGALTIAREGRVSLQRLNEALKRENRALRMAAIGDDGTGEPDDAARAKPSNVSVFTLASKEKPTSE